MKWSLFPPRIAIVALTGALLAGFSGCKVQRKGDGANKKLDMDTPMGSVHVNTQVDPKDTGLAVYPGATRTEEDGHTANFSIDSSLFGAKVVTIKYHSDDSPGEVLDFYRKQLRAYGEVTECHGKVDIAGSEARCHPSGLGEETNLLTGTQERRHVVSVKGDGKGSNFVLVFLQTHRGSGTL